MNLLLEEDMFEDEVIEESKLEEDENSMKLDKGDAFIDMINKKTSR